MPNDLYHKLSIHQLDKEIHYKKKNKIVIFGNFGACNYGDEAILSGELQELRRIPEIKIIVVSRFPESVKALHNVTSISLFSLHKIVAAVLSSSSIILGGGGIVCKNDKGFFSLLYQCYIFFLSSLLPLMVGKPLYVFGVGFYNNANPLVKRLYSFMFKKAKLVTVRDAVSLATLKKYHVPVQLYKDISFLMPILTKNEIKQNPYFAAMYNPHRLHVGLSLKQPKNKDEEKKLLETIGLFIIDNALTTDFWFYSLDYHPKYENDKLFGQKLYTYIQKTFQKPFSFHFVPITLSVQDTFSSFQLMDYMITMRFHGSVFAYRQQVPFLGITYDEKCTSFLESIGENPYTPSDISFLLLEKQLQRAVSPTRKRIIKVDIESTLNKARKEKRRKKEVIFYGN